ncbi:MAG: chromate transporter [Clostridia bacterium]|nr:chromate transporter [Clostridia bacterium]
MIVELLVLFFEFFKIGLFTFGGGYAMIPLVTETALSYGMTQGEVMNFIAVAESTPGPIAINMATFIGTSQFGIVGAIVATLGVVLPSFIIILLIAALLKNVLKYQSVQATLSSIRPTIVSLILSTALTMFLSVVFGISTVYSPFSFDWRAIVIFLLIVGVAITYKKLRKKAVSPILLILFSAILGMLFY